MSRNISSANTKVILLLTLIHFTGDFYSAFITPLLPVFSDKFMLSLTQVGLISGLSRFLAFIVQPSVGYMADRYRTRFFVLGGLLLAIVFIPLAGIASSYSMLLIFIVMGSIGSSMFHPSVAGMISTHSGSRLGLSMSIFNTGGTLAFALGPVFITWYVAELGIEWMPVTMLAGLGVALYLFFTVPVPESEGLGQHGFLGSLKEAFGDVWRSIFLIWLIMVMRAFAAHSFRTFVPILYSGEGYSLFSIGVLVSLFTVAGTLSGLYCGYLSDRIGFKKIFFVTHALATPLLLLVLVARGIWIFPTIFLAGFAVMATLPLGVTMAQELAPRGRSLVSSIMMGFAFGLGGILSPGVGALADLFSIRSVLAAVALMPLLTTVFIYFLPERKDAR